MKANWKYSVPFMICSAKYLPQVRKSIHRSIRSYRSSQRIFKTPNSLTPIWLNKSASARSIWENCFCLTIKLHPSNTFWISESTKQSRCFVIPLSPWLRSRKNAVFPAFTISAACLSSEPVWHLHSTPKIIDCSKYKTDTAPIYKASIRKHRYGDINWRANKIPCTFSDTGDSSFN